eukprot:CAMPEP_0173398838 /NCGR_PEP_ID=MMETSP1356-20130122/43100_1 /TAXON_ID=77927 ORGANISM="Hemiselmis virescens, Strain PCC157" /NCGR_SAMPLE_ID=MMETSP1356 /ASSEMBLY_ACC=CAM_ASM_000847 /LENGTH=42 /DNA_ID= /DNA_START= /DNA_END= /DNA_ORIENTATION=
MGTRTAVGSQVQAIEIRLGQAEAGSAAKAQAPLWRTFAGGCV